MASIIGDQRVDHLLFVHMTANRDQLRPSGARSMVAKEAFARPKINSLKACRRPNTRFTILSRVVISELE
jgi:hypothetical protein